MTKPIIPSFPRSRLGADFQHHRTAEPPVVGLRDLFAFAFPLSALTSCLVLPEQKITHPKNSRDGLFPTDYPFFGDLATGPLPQPDVAAFGTSGVFAVVCDNRDQAAANEVI